MFKIFLKRPVVVIALSLMFLFMGILAMKTLPISLFPDIAPPRAAISISFPGSCADVLVNLVPDYLRTPCQWRARHE